MLSRNRCLHSRDKVSYLSWELPSSYINICKLPRLTRLPSTLRLSFMPWKLHFILCWLRSNAMLKGTDNASFNNPCNSIAYGHIPIPNTWERGHQEQFWCCLDDVKLIFKNKKFRGQGIPQKKPRLLSGMLTETSNVPNLVWYNSSLFAWITGSNLIYHYQHTSDITFKWTQTYQLP